MQKYNVSNYKNELLTQPYPRFTHQNYMNTQKYVSRSLFIVSFLILILLVSCSDDKLTPNDLIGKWNWESSSGGFAGTTFTPENTGDHITIEFTSDSVFRKYLNDSLVMESTFSVQSSESIYDHNPTQMLVFDTGYMRQSFRFASPNELVLLDEAYDGFISHYIRIN